jgi:hypothetical protein
MQATCLEGAALSAAAVATVVDAVDMPGSGPVSGTDDHAGA